MSTLELVEVTGDGRFGLRWTFTAIGRGHADTRIHVHTLSSGRVVDLQTDDGHAGGTGDSALDELVAERIRKIIVLHRAFRGLDNARALDDARRPSRQARWAAPHRMRRAA